MSSQQQEQKKYWTVGRVLLVAIAISFATACFFMIPVVILADRYHKGHHHTSNGGRLRAGEEAQFGATEREFKIAPQRRQLDTTAPQTGSGYMSRYWDCAKPSCGWAGKASSGGFARSCAIDGQTTMGANEQSAHMGGNAYTCFDNAPFEENDVLAYGFVAAPIAADRPESETCGSCFEISFTGSSSANAYDMGSQALAGKKMIVQSTNVGTDVNSNQFDLLIPGGGLGKYDACTAQFGGPTTKFGNTYGGFLNACYDTHGYVTGSTDAEKTAQHNTLKQCVRDHCTNVFSGDSQMLQGCNFFVEWFEMAENPMMTWKAVTCPSALSQKTGFSNNDHVAGSDDSDDDDDLDDDNDDDDDADDGAADQNTTLVWQSKAARGSCDEADLLEHSGNWNNESDVRDRCLEIGCKMYTVSFDKDRKKKEAWFCEKNNWDDKDASGKWKKWRVGHRVAATDQSVTFQSAKGRMYGDNANDLLEHSRGWTSEANAQERCRQIPGCVAYTWSKNKDRNYRQAWFYSSDAAFDGRCKNKSKCYRYFSGRMNSNDSESITSFDALN